MKRFLVILSAIAVAVAMAGVTSAADKPAPTSVVLKDLKAPMGGVKFDHAKHSKMAGVKCESCHHASKPAKAYAAGTTHEACGDCHTKPATAPVKTVNPYHAAMAKSGLCVDCHVKETAAGKKAPAKCPECHKKENA